MRMDLLKFKTDSSKTLYFNQYKYKVCLPLTGAHLTRGISTIEKFNERVAKRNNRINQYIQSLIHGDPLKNINSDLIEKFMKWQLVNGSKLQIRLEFDKVHFYSNDIPLLETILTISPNIDCYQALDLQVPAGIKYFSKQPKFQYRVYLKDMLLAENDYQDLKKFHYQYEYSSEFKFSPGLTYILKNNRRYIIKYYIDCKTETSMTHLYLLFSNILGKKYKLEKRP
jgi:hypothetical protein